MSNLTFIAVIICAALVVAAISLVVFVPKNKIPIFKNTTDLIVYDGATINNIPTSDNYNIQNTKIQNATSAIMPKTLNFYKATVDGSVLEVTDTYPINFSMSSISNSELTIRNSYLNVSETMLKNSTVYLFNSSFSLNNLYVYQDTDTRHSNITKIETLAYENVTATISTKDGVKVLG